jgi:hypothetical protein
MIEQAAVVASAPVSHLPTAGVVVAITLSSGALLTALGTLWKVGHWMGRRESTEEHVEQRLENIAEDVREIRALLMKKGSA